MQLWYLKVTHVKTQRYRSLNVKKTGKYNQNKHNVIILILDKTFKTRSSRYVLMSEFT